jgi:DNA polymerase-3 subunit epsilon
MDTETTGLSADQGDRVVEIGCVELMNHIPSGKTWQTYLNPQRPNSSEAFRVHGLSDEFLAGQPLFADVVDIFLEFIGDAPLVMHNAGFDLGMINAELKRVGREPLPLSRIVDTLAMAQRKYSGAAGNSLDALCARFGIDRSRRELHGALLDSELLAEVYLELIGGRQTGFDLGFSPRGGSAGSDWSGGGLPDMAPYVSRLTGAERDAHLKLIEKIGKTAVWNDYLRQQEPTPDA